jgi:hypothetical protein
LARDVSEAVVIVRTRVLQARGDDPSERMRVRRQASKYGVAASARGGGAASHLLEHLVLVGLLHKLPFRRVQLLHCALQGFVRLDLLLDLGRGAVVCHCAVQSRSLTSGSVDDDHDVHDDVR